MNPIEQEPPQWAQNAASLVIHCEFRPWSDMSTEARLIAIRAHEEWKGSREAAQLSERKTVHEWLNAAGITTQEEGKEICLLRRLRIAFDHFDLDEIEARMREAASPAYYAAAELAIAALERMDEACEREKSNFNLAEHDRRYWGALQDMVITPAIAALASAHSSAKGKA